MTNAIDIRNIDDISAIRREYLTLMECDFDLFLLELKKKKIPFSDVMSLTDYVSNNRLWDIILAHPKILNDFNTAHKTDYSSKFLHYLSKKVDEKDYGKYLSYFPFKNMPKDTQYSMSQWFGLDNLLLSFDPTDFKITLFPDAILHYSCKNPEVALKKLKPIHSKLSSNTWLSLLTHIKTSAIAEKYCDFDKMSPTAMSSLVTYHSRFLPYLNLDKINKKSAWRLLISYYPQFADTEEYFAFKIKGG